MRRIARDRAQATPLMAAALGLVALMLLALGPMGRALTDRAQARTAADAAALAGAAQGEAVARDLASANGAELVSYDSENHEVVVEVQVGSVAARSRARRVEVLQRGSPGGVRSAAEPGGRANLAPSMLEALRRADELLGEPVPITSGFRSPQKQRELWERRRTNPFPVAPPGSSMHERGLAVDVPSHFVGRLLTVAGDAGLCQTLPQSDPIHFELCGAR
jgi:uncharacterized protein YcbK (DUF882 family)